MSGVAVCCCCCCYYFLQILNQLEGLGYFLTSRKLFSFFNFTKWNEALHFFFLCHKCDVALGALCPYYFSLKRVLADTVNVANVAETENFLRASPALLPRKICTPSWSPQLGLQRCELTAAKMKAKWWMQILFITLSGPVDITLSCWPACPPSRGSDWGEARDHNCNTRNNPGTPMRIPTHPCHPQLHCQKHLKSKGTRFQFQITIKRVLNPSLPTHLSTAACGAISSEDTP